MEEINIKLKEKIKQKEKEIESLKDKIINLEEIIGRLNFLNSESNGRILALSDVINKMIKDLKNR